MAAWLEPAGRDDGVAHELAAQAGRDVDALGWQEIPQLTEVDAMR
jgi:hypothetical protein